MKTNKLYILLIVIIFLGCSQELEMITPTPDPDPDPDPPLSGAANFSKFVAVGNSLTAGYQAGALFNEGQENSLPKIMNDMFSMISGATGGGAFNQPDIDSELGFFGIDPGSGTVLGRLLLQGDPPIPTPQPGGNIPGAYTGDKSALNNFGVPGILLGQALIPDTGNPASPFYNGLWARFASVPGVKSILEDALAAQPTFFLLWLGNNDVLGYAVGGAVAEDLPIFTDPAAFDFLYQALLGAFLLADPDVKGVVCNIPGITSIPFFTTVPWNSIPLDAATAGALNVGLAPVNGAFDGLVLAGLLSQADADSRKMSYVEGANPVLLVDEDLENLGPKFDILVGAGFMTAEQQAGVEPFLQSRQANSGDLIPLTSASVLGVELAPNVIQGVSFPLSDEYVLTADEITSINDRIDAFNTTIKNAADANSRVAYVDINSQFAALAGDRTAEDELLIDGSIAPPFALFSEDGVHPNSRGYALAAKWIIMAINTEFGAVVPEPNLADYDGTALPIQ